MTEEYFKGIHAAWLPDGQAIITKACVRNLSFDAFQCSPCRYEWLRSLSKDYPLVDYAAKYWDDHTCVQKDTDKASMTLVLRFLQDDLKVAFINYINWQPLSFSGMNWSAFFDLKKIIEHQLEVVSDKDSRDVRGQTPLSIVAESGHKGVVELVLVQHNVELNSEDNDGQIPLSFAAENDCEAVVCLLLEQQDIEVNSKDVNGWTLLSLATLNRSEAVVHLLLE